MGMLEVVVIAGLIQFSLHYFPWRILLRGRKLPRLAAYTLGLLGVMAPYSAWLYARHEFEALQALWVVVTSGGVVVFALYGLDHYLDLIMRDIESTQREKMVMDSIRDTQQ
jgi:hypothetical protein